MDKHSVRKKPSCASCEDSPSTSSVDSRKTIQFEEYPNTVEIDDVNEERPSRKPARKQVESAAKVPIGRNTPVENSQFESGESSREHVNNPEEYPYVVEIPEQEEKKPQKGRQSAKSKIK